MKGLEDQGGHTGKATGCALWGECEVRLDHFGRDRREPDPVGFACYVRELRLHLVNNGKTMMAFQIFSQKYCSRKKGSVMGKNER